MESTRKPDRLGWVVLALVLVILIASYYASRIQNSGGEVSVRTITLPTQNGQWVSAELLKPRSATVDSPAPVVIVVPGFQRSKETLLNIGIELSRRGVVVITLDPYAQGNSSSSVHRQSATTEGYGLFAFVEYLHDTDLLNYIDKSRIAATGHSAGGNAAIRGAAHFGRQASKSNQPSKLQSVYVSGYVLTLKKGVLKGVRSNLGVSYALYDEGAYRNEFAKQPPVGEPMWAAADMRFAPESLRVIASGVGADAAPTEVEVGRYYGSVDDRTLRIVHNERTIHPIQPYMLEATANQLDFFEHVFDLDWSRDLGISSQDQVWQNKELLTLLSLICAFVMLVPLARLLLKLPFLHSLVQSMPEALPRPRRRGRAIFWFVFLLSGLISCFTFVPLCELSQRLFVSASNREQTWFFPQRMNNAVMLWAVLNGLIGFALFLLTVDTTTQSRRLRLRQAWGLYISFRDLLKTFALAITLFVAFFVLLGVVHWLFHVDYRFLFLSVRAFRSDLLLLLPMYAPLFFIFFFSNSLRVNSSMRFEGVSEWSSMLLAGVANTIGLVLILTIQYWVFFETGTVFWTDSWLYVNLLFAVVPIMFVLPFYHRLFFRMTGRVYLGPLTTSLVFVMILLTNTVCYIPL